MAAKATAFVTGAGGFIGMQLVGLLLARGYEVLGLVNTPEGAARVRRAGAAAIVGDLLQPGRWQDEAAADWVFHLSPGWMHGPDPWRPLEAAALTRLRMDGNLLDAVSAGATRRVVYVAPAACYGATGPRPITEDEPVRPSRSGRLFRPALERLDGYRVAGLPVVTALPGCVYGNGSWFRERVIAPVLARRPLLRPADGGSWISPIHVHDCVRAFVHLAEYGAVGGCYFLVNSAAIRLYDLAAAFARLAERPLRGWIVPAAAARLYRRVLFDNGPCGDAVFSNIRLRGIDFQFEYPTVDEGLRQVVAELGE